MRFQCPACGTGMRVDETFDGRMYVACDGCSIGGLVPYNENRDEAFLEFLVMYDDGRLEAAPRTRGAEPAAAADPPQSGHAMIRSRPDIDGMIGGEEPDRLTRDILYSRKDYLADYRVIREPEPEYGRSTAEAGLDAKLAAALVEAGIKRLYKYQDAAIRSITAGRNTVIEAPTASGKTEAFLIPIIQNIIRHIGRGEDGGGRGGKRRGVYAVVTYPTKALSRDQIPKIQKLAGAAGLSAEVFDGDTPASAKSRIAGNPPHILVTNFDLLHHHMWRRTALGRTLHTARMLIVDEAHSYSGIFGSNVHYIIKRLVRIAGGAAARRVQFVAASATLDDPSRFCSELFGIKDVTVIRGSGPSRHIEFAMLFPSLRKPRVLMAHVTKKFATSGHQTMVFSNSHRNSELLAIHCQRQGVKITVHRAGLLPEHRMQTEARFKSGALQAISCTPTLELGIDVGGVDCVVSAPTPINRLVQRIGRAARREGRRGYAFLVLGDDPISQYYKNHPRDYFEDVERAYIDSRNPYVEECQIVAMAHDMPIRAGEMPQHADTIRRLVRKGSLKAFGDTIMAPASPPSPPRGGGSGDKGSAKAMLENYSIRGMGQTVDIMRGGRKVADRVCPIALEELHKGAVYFLAGRPYMVRRFDYPARQYAEIEELPRNHPYYTRALTYENPYIEEIMERRTVNGIEVAFCRLRIQKFVTGYVRKSWTNLGDSDSSYLNDGLGDDADSEGSDPGVALDRPLEYTYVTKGVAFCAPVPYDEVQKAAEKRATVRQAGATGLLPQQQQSVTPHDVVPANIRLEEDYITTSGYHATEHVVIEGSNMITGGASRNLGGISMGSSGMIFVHDGVVGGSGASRALYDRLEKAFERGMRIVGECPCSSESGCPRCTMSYRCGNNNQYLHKMAALEIFERINDGQKTTLLDSFEGHNPIV